MSNVTVAGTGALGPLSQRMLDAARSRAPGQTNELAAGVTSGFAILTLRGKVWRVKHRGEEHPQLRKDDGTPKAAVDVVIVKAAPNLSKIFYEKGYNPDDTAAAPDCWSVNGVTPDAGAAKKQSTTCAGCPKNAWGSRVSETGKSGKACQDSKRLAVVPIDDMDNEVFGGPMLLRVPPASLADMATYASKLEQLGYPPYGVVTRLKFDMAAEFPKIIFEPGTNPAHAYPSLTDDQFAKVEAMRLDPRVSRILSEPVEEVRADVLPTAAPAVDAFANLPPKAPAQPAAAPAQAAPAPAPVAPAAPAVAPTPVAQPAPAAPAAPAGPSMAELMAQIEALKAAQTVVQPVSAPLEPTEVLPPEPVQQAAPVTQTVTVEAVVEATTSTTSFDEELEALLK